MKYYVVQINIKPKRLRGKKPPPMFVVCDKWDAYPVKLTKSKSGATKFSTRGSAECMSSHFWEHYWKKFEEQFALDTREVTLVKGLDTKYLKAVKWIAMNDESGAEEALEKEFVSDMISVSLLSDLFNKPREKIAADVVRFRKRAVQKGRL